MNLRDTVMYFIISDINMMCREFLDVLIYKGPKI
jgi:hypothetical protein